jgi:hypothetical protein
VRFQGTQQTTTKAETMTRIETLEAKLQNATLKLALCSCRSDAMVQRRRINGLTSALKLEKELAAKRFEKMCS